MSQKEIIDDDISFRSLTEEDHQRLALLRKEYGENYEQVNKAQLAIIATIAIDVVFVIIAAVADSMSSNKMWVTVSILFVFAIALLLTFRLGYVVTGLGIVLMLYPVLAILSMTNHTVNVFNGLFVRVVVSAFLLNGILHAIENVPILKAIKSLSADMPVHKLFK